jgi:hypothetical protein
MGNCFNRGSGRRSNFKTRYSPRVSLSLDEPVVNPPFIEDAKRQLENLCDGDLVVAPLDEVRGRHMRPNTVCKQWRISMNKAFMMAVAAVGLTIGLASYAPPAEARGRKVEGQVTGQRGTATVQGETTREKGRRTSNRTVTGPNGKARTTTEEATRNRETGTRTRDRDTTFANGETRSVDATAQKTAPGAYTTSRTVTTRDGDVRNQTGDFAVTKTDDGRSVAGTITTQNNGVVSYQKDVARTDGVRTVTSTSTFPDGAARSNTNTTTRTETGAVVAKDTTFRDRTTRSVDATRTKSETGVVVERVIVGRNGETRTQTGDLTVTPKE